MVSTTRRPGRSVGLTRARVGQAARLQVGQLLEQLCHKLELLMQDLSFSGIHRGPSHRVDLLINGTRGIHDRVL